MKILKALAVVLTITMYSSCDTLEGALGNMGGGPLTNEEVVRGLKTALDVGTDSAVKRLTATDGYLKDLAIKIFLPPEAQNIITYASKIPGGQALVDKTIMAINRAAEDAASEAAPIFSNSIRSMSISDAFGILRGADTAATNYLRRTTFTELHGAFQPKISTSLSKPLVFNTSAEKLYTDLVSTYNTASLGGSLFPKITETSLSGYVTGKALDGLFKKIAIEEKLIREDPVHRVTAILKRVFGSQQY